VPSFVDFRRRWFVNLGGEIIGCGAVLLFKIGLYFVAIEELGQVDSMPWWQ
jgi:hypothetical protein